MTWWLRSVFLLWRGGLGGLDGLGRLDGLGGLPNLGSLGDLGDLGSLGSLGSLGRLSRLIVTFLIRKMSQNSLGDAVANLLFGDEAQLLGHRRLGRLGPVEQPRRELLLGLRRRRLRRWRLRRWPGRVAGGRRIFLGHLKGKRFLTKKLKGTNQLPCPWSR